MKKTIPKPGKPANVTLIKSFDQLQERCAGHTLCHVKIDGQVFAIPVRRLTPAIKEEVLAILRGPTPPALKGGQAGEYNFMAPQYRAEKEKAELMARAMVVSSGCPVIAEKHPGLTNPEDILKFIRGFASDLVLDILAAKIQDGAIEIADVERLANFTPPPASAS